ncbi:MAG TPA: ABC transporter permease [Brevefilum sp.]|nr:ABC transporter permease [Brevefilum sp.]HOR19523.1 ABC transporter permease [Brevefilum sp.]HPL68763.1 ABC transporter permease [Brevefilum sp.]
MNKIWSIIRKDILIRFTSPVEWMFFLILPILFIFILSGSIGIPADSRLDLMTVDQANSPLSASLIAELEKSSSIKPLMSDLKNALDSFESRQASSVLIIPKSFTVEALQEGQAELELKQQRNNLNALVQQQAVQTAAGRISSVVDIANKSVELAESLQPFANGVERQTFFDESYAAAQNLMESAPELVTTLEGKTEDSINYDPRSNNTAGQMVTWVFIPLIGLSAMFALERTGGTLRRILVTPTSKALYISGTVLGQVLTALLQMAIMVTFGAVVMKINWLHAPLALFLVMLTSVLAAAALGTMLGTFVKTEGQANGLSILIGMVMAMMGGCWYPIELFPPMMRTAAQALPTYWAMNGFLNIAVRGQGLSGVLFESAVLLGFALVFFVIGVWRFRYE